MTQNLPIKIRRYAESAGLNRIVGPFSRQDVAQAYYDGERVRSGDVVFDGVLVEYNENTYLVYKDDQFPDDEDLTYIEYEPEVLEAEEV